jgi:NitT/TauT family transport system permease protein
MNFVLRLTPILIVALLWELAPRLGWVNRDLLPPLSLVGEAWWRQTASGELPWHAIASLTNCALGLGLGILIGSALGVLMAWSPLTNAMLGPLLQMTYPIPRTALVPVMILWLGLGAASKIAAIFSACLLPVIVSAYNGARGVDQMLIWSARGLGASERQVLTGVLFPGAFADIMAGVRNAIGIAFVLMVTSEFLVGGRGVGYLISFLGDAGAYPAMFGVVLTVAALGFRADRAYLRFMRHALRWRE